MSETRDMMASPGGSAPLHQRIDSMQVGCLPWGNAAIFKMHLFVFSGEGEGWNWPGRLSIVFKIYDIRLSDFPS